MNRVKTENIDRLSEIYSEAKARRIVLNKDEFAKKVGYSRSQIFKMTKGEYEITEDVMRKAENVLNETENDSNVNNNPKPGQNSKVFCILCYQNFSYEQDNQIPSLGYPTKRVG